MWLPRYVAPCPKVTIRINGVPFTALLDTGSQVTTLQKGAYMDYWDLKELIQPPDTWLTVIASNGQPIPHQGYWEPTLQVGELKLPRQGVIVVDVDDKGTSPVVLGMNVLRNCYGEMLEALQVSLPTAPGPTQRTIQHAIRTLTAQQRFTNQRGEVCRVRIRDTRPVVLQPGTETMLWCRARPGIGGQDYQALVEPIPTEEHPMVRAARSLVTVSNGRVPVRLLNIGDTSVELHKFYPVAQLSQVTFEDILSVEVASCHQAIQTQEDKGKSPKESWWTEIHVGDVTTPAEQINGVLAVARKYHQAFSQHPLDFGKTTLLQHTIPTGDHPPIKERHRPLPPAMYQSVKKLIHEMKEADVIQDSQSPWAAPLVLVKKKDGTIRFCVDYRKLNNITHKDAYPLPRIEESLTALGTGAYFSTLDLTSGYWQVPMAPQDREKTAFTTPMGLFEFNSMPFGLCNAPATFQRLMERCLGHKNFESVLLYLDDVIIFSKSYEDHLRHLAEVFQVLIKHGLKIKPSKCHLMKPRVNYLGHVVSAEGVMPDPEKISAVQDWPTPTTVKEVRSFLGFAGYYRRFIPHFAQVAEPLQELIRGYPCEQLKRRLPIEWTERQETAFQTLKKLLTQPPVLGYPDYSQPFRLYTDASKQGLGAVLSQIQNKKERVIAYASRGLRGAEKNDQNYSSFKLEFLALVWAVTEKFKDYLAATPFVVYTDNNPLAHLNTAKLGALEQRWASKLANYDFLVKYRTGKSNVNADALSRLPTEEEPPRSDDWEEVEMPAFYSRFAQQDATTIKVGGERSSQLVPSDHLQDKAKWKTLQEESRVLGELQDFLVSRRVPDRLRRGHPDMELARLWRQRKRLFIQKGLIMRSTLDPISGERLHQILIPRRDSRVVLEAYHDQSGHFGVQKTEATIRRRFYWVGMRSDIEAWCKECSACTLARGERHDQKAPLHPIVSHQPLEIVAIDHVKLEPSRTGYTYAMTIIDHYTKFVVAIPVKDQTAKTTAANFWKSFMLPYGCPEKILTDRGPAFESQLFQELCTLYNCQKLRTTAYHPQGNGLCEKMNQTLIEMLRTVPPAKRADWPTLLPELVYMYNNTIHCSTGYTPYFLMFGRQGKLPSDIALNVQVPDTINPLPQTDWVNDHQRRLADAREIVDARMEKARQKQQDDYNLHARALPFQIGDKVWLKKNHRTGKLDTKWETKPYIIKTIPYPETDVYEIIKEGKEPQVVHRNRLKLCLKEDIPPEPETTEPSLTEEVTPLSSKEKNSSTDFLSTFFVPWLTFFAPNGSAPTSFTAETDTSPEEQTVTNQPATTVDALILRRSERSTKGKMPSRYCD